MKCSCINEYDLRLLQRHHKLLRKYIDFNDYKNFNFGTDVTTCLFQIDNCRFINYTMYSVEIICRAQRIYKIIHNTF